MTPQFALRLTSTADDLLQLEQALLRMTGSNRSQRATLASTYYDTAAGRLSRSGIALQVRRQNSRYIQIVDKAGIDEEPLLARSEWKDVIDGERPDLRASNGSILLLEALGDAELREQFTTALHRISFMI